jgi:SAM-dependent methyltransferase
MKCRACEAELSHVLVDLVASPPSNSYLSAQNLQEPETFYPLKVFVCEQCWLVQLDEVKQAEEIFDSNYAYFSSYSSSWLAHAKQFSDTATQRFELGADSFVIEVASNDGYLLKNFVASGIPCLGIEPTSSTADVAIAEGVPTRKEFFGRELGAALKAEGQAADLVVCNNVLAHVPDLHDFIAGLKNVLKPTGVVSVEFPHLLELVKHSQFDTIYHEHFSYLSLTALVPMFKTHGLRIFDVEQLTTHGGSLRLWITHLDRPEIIESSRFLQVQELERETGLGTLEYYATFSEQVASIRDGFISFLVQARKEGRTVAAYGAAAKGNTLLNYCGTRPDQIAYVVDRSPHKQGLFMPGSHLPIVDESVIKETKPDYLILLPWNLKSELTEQLAYVRDWGGKLVVAIPQLDIF